MKKIIGICTTKINDEFSRNFISLMHASADREKFSIAVFHSIFDFYDSTVETGARAIFDILPYEDLCAVVILRDALFDKAILNTIINGARANKVPVIMARGYDKRCYSITGSFKQAYAELLSSVIKAQGVTDTYFIAGRKQDDPDSAERLAVYKKVLEENGCAFDPERVEYGEYWENPTIKAVKRMIDRNGKAPGAVFCSNDIMAFTVMEQLKEMGIRVPEDTAVTGFDGLDNSKYCDPSLSTCCENTEELVSIALSTVIRLVEGGHVPDVQHYTYNAAIRQSSEKSRKVKAEDLNTRIFYLMRADEINERDCNKWLDSAVSVPSIENLRRNMPAMAKNGYSVSIRADAFLEADSGVKSPTEYLIMRRDKNGAASESFARAGELAHKYLEQAPEGQTCFFSMISNNDLIYGLAFTPSSDIQSDTQKINRFIRTLNRALYIALCGEKQRKNIGEQLQKKYTDALTGTLNIDGANKWFSDEVTNDFTRINQLCVGVYTFINYQQVLEKCGTHILEENMQYIAKSLKLSNPENSTIARISVDSFAVLMLHEPDEDFSAVVDNAISLFYGSLDIKSKSGSKNSDIEVSCGYHDTVSPWLGKLSDYLNAAISSLYRNRVTFEKHMPKDISMNDSSRMLEYRAAFMTLINDDLFVYHFQPIVDARTGEVIAYEALMRTRDCMIKSPIDVLTAASMFSKLGKVELLSFLNIFRRMSEEPESFAGKSVFINTIPGHFLDDEQCEAVFRKYGDLLSQTVIEITESETITLDELEAIRTFGGNRDNIRIAVDDYGTGHSNIVNLMEYKPQIVKIDRYLITNIQNDKNKQMLVKSLIEFSGENSIKVLAEGVETSEELEAVIDLGVDYIQGYYTAKPQAQIIQQIPEDIKRQITERAAARKK